MSDDPTQPVSMPMRYLVGLALNGRLALPEFQRDFSWRPAAVRRLLASVAKDWPIGSFTIWSATGQPLGTRAFDGLDDVEARADADYLLDGQGRLTALIHALHPEYSQQRYFVDGLSDFFAAGAEEEIDDYLDSLPAKQFEERFPTLEDRARSDVALIADIVDDAVFGSWANAFRAQHPDSRGDVFFHHRATRLPGLRSYEIPCVRLSSRIGVAAVAGILSRVTSAPSQAA